MSNPLTEAADLLENYAKRYERFNALAAQLRELGNLENRAREMAAAAQRLSEQDAGLRTAIAQHTEEARAAKAEAAAAAATAKERVAEIVAGAKAEAERILREAKASAAAETRAADEHKAKAEADAALAKAKLEATQAELDKVNVRLAEARAAAKRMLESQ